MSSYIASLVEHVKAIQIRSASIPRSSPLQERPQISETTHTPQAEHVFAYTHGAYRYIGGSSCLAAATHLRGSALTVVLPALHLEPTYDEDSIGPDVFVHLGQLYLDEIETFFPLLDDRLRSMITTSPRCYSALPQRLALFMIHSIACQLVRGPDLHRWRLLGENFRQQAMELLEANTTNATIPTLRIILLLAIYSLFATRQGNIGQQIALAIRLAIDLASQDLPKGDSVAIQQMFIVIFCLENEIATCLDRPATFSEPVSCIIVVPSTLNAMNSYYTRVHMRYRLLIDCALYTEFSTVFARGTSYTYLQHPSAPKLPHWCILCICRRNY